MMVDVMQDILDVVYPNVKYMVNPNGAVFTVVSSF
jgi:hypothetical protein